MLFKSRITRLLSISDREYPRLISLSLVLFLLMFGWAYGSAGRDSFFIKQLGPEKLPLMYVINSITLVLGSFLYAIIVDRFSRVKLLWILLLFSSASLLGLRYMIFTGNPLAPYFVFTGSELIMNILIIMHFWTVANGIFDAREGKRIFPLLGGAGLIGAIIGGGSIQFVVARIGTENLFLVWSLLLAITLPAAFGIQKVATIAPTESGRDQDENQERPSFREDLAGVWEVPLIRTLTYMSFPMLIAVYIIDYQFYEAVNEVFVDQDKLSAFLGLVDSSFSFCGLMLQLFISQRILQRFGVGTVNLVHPISTLVGAGLLNIRAFCVPSQSPSLLSFRTFSVVAASASDEVVNLSIGGSARQLLFNAINEGKRGKSRAFISGTVEPVGVIFAGLFLILSVNILGVSESFLASVLLGLCLIWLLLAFRIKAHYVHSLVENLGSRNQGMQSIAMSELSNTTDPRTIAELLQSVSSDNEEVGLFALAILRETRFDGQVQSLCSTLTRSTAAVRIETLSVLTALKQPETVTLIIPHLRTSDPVFRAAVVGAIGKLGSDDELEMLSAYLKDTNPNVRAEAIIPFLKKPKESSHYRMGMDSLEILANDKSSISHGLAAYVIGELKSSSLVPLLKQLINAQDEDVQIAVIGAIGRVHDEDLIGKLVGFLANNRLRIHVVDAIVNIGADASGPLHAQLRNPEVEIDIKMQIVYCLGRLGDIRSIKELLDLLKLTDRSLSIEEETVRALTSIRKNSADSDCEAIAETTEQISASLNDLLIALKSQRSTVNFISDLEEGQSSFVLMDALSRATQRREGVALNYLEFLADPDIIRTAKENLNSSDQRARAEALEVLEGSCDQGRALATLLEGELSESWNREIITNSAQVFEKILRDNRDPWVCCCTLYAISQLRLPEFEEKLIEWQNQRAETIESDPLVKANFELALSHCSNRETTEDDKAEMDKMELNMKRILFLRSVPLFVDVEGTDLHWISSIIKDRAYQSGEAIVKEGDQGDAMYLIESGSVRVVTGEDQQVTLAILEEREYFGEMSLLDSERRSATVVAHKDAHLLVIRRDDFYELLIARPKISFSLFKTLSQRLRATLAKLSANQKRELFSETQEMVKKAATTIRLPKSDAPTPDDNTKDS